MKNPVRIIGVCVVVFLAWGCGGGGGDGGPEALGLFEPQANNSPVGSVSTSPEPNGDALLVSELAMGDTGTSVSARKNLTDNFIVFPSLSLFSSASRVG